MNRLVVFQGCESGNEEDRRQYDIQSNAMLDHVSLLASTRSKKHNIPPCFIIPVLVMCNIFKGLQIQKNAKPAGWRVVGFSY
jgi:hypothetical protein